MKTQKLIPIAAFLLRAVAGLLFLQAGGVKLFGWFGGMPEGMALTPLLMTAGILEVAGGSLMILGLFTRPAAFIIAGEMAVAYFIAHVATQGNLLVPSLNAGLPAVLFCFVFLFFAAYGGGEWSLDAWMKNRKSA